MRVDYLVKTKIWSEWLAGEKPRHLAERYGVSVNTIRSWHYREAWAYSRASLLFFAKCGLRIPFEVSVKVSDRRKKRISENQTLKKKVL